MISIITIIYNNLKGLEKTARSVTSQNSDYEWIIIDGASNDGTTEYLKTLSARIVSEPDNGIYDAMNKGMAKSTGDYIIFMNAGDEFADTDVLTKIKRLIHDENQPDFIFGPALEERENSVAVLKPARAIRSLRWGMITHHQAMFYKKALCKNLKYDDRYKIAADYDFTCRFVQNTIYTHQVDFPICLFESGGVSQTSYLQGRREQYRIKKNLGLVSPIENIMIYMIQTCAMFLKQTCPSIYWVLRRRAK